MKMKPERGIDVVRVGGVQIAIDYSWILIFLLVVWSLSAGYFPRTYPGQSVGAYWAIGTVATLLFFASVVAHELMHALMANRLGQPVRRITLFIFGGMAHLSREPSDPATELKIAAVGPLTSFFLGGVFWLAQGWAETAQSGTLVVAMFGYLAIINVTLAVFNLLPGFPLDGGRLLRAALWYRWRDLRRATAAAANWGSGIGLGLIALGAFEIFGGALVGGLWLILIGAFLRGAAQSTYQHLVAEQALGAAHVRDLMVVQPAAVPADATVTQAVNEHFLRHGFGGYPVVRDGHVEGVVTLRQVKECSPAERDRRTVGDIMRHADGSLCVAASASAADALRQMRDVDSGRLLVTDHGNVIGLITRSGISRFVQIRTELDETAAAA
jgi:Zn-dependent protease/predicted transcriptional regulator